MTDTIIYLVFNAEGNFEFETTDRAEAEFTVKLYGGYVDIDEE